MNCQTHKIEDRKIFEKENPRKGDTAKLKESNMEMLLKTLSEGTCSQTTNIALN